MQTGVSRKGRSPGGAETADAASATQVPPTEQPSVRMPRRRGARLYLGGSVVGQACALLRYTLLARLLGPEQLGLVATLILASNFFELLSDTGSDRFLVQDAEGDTPQVQSLVQLVFLGRGAFMAAGLAICAIPIAALYHQPQLVAGLAILGLSPLIAGLTHLDMRRIQRRNDFRTEGLATLISEILSLAATLTAAFLTRSYTAILYGLVVRSLAVVVISHLMAERPYRLHYTRDIARRLAAFSGPLIANGVLLFMAGQSDRLIVSTLGLAALGHYSAVLLLVLYPTAALTRYVAGIHLPLVSANPRSTAPDAAPELLAGRSLLLAMGIAVGFAAFGPLAVRILYGAKFAEAPLLIGLIGVLQTGRFVRVWPTTLAIGLARSKIVMANNFARMVGIPAAFAGLAVGGGVAGVVVGFIVGEFAALITAVVLLNRARGLASSYDFDRIGLFAAGSAVIVAALAALQNHSTFGLIIAALASFGIAGWLVRRERASLMHGLDMARRLVRRAP
jgi:O-antigen/teichoic acid export membrane protein